MQNKLITFVTELPDLEKVVNYLPPLKVLLCSPDYFDVVDVKNVYMDGMEGQVNKEMAKHQWEELRNVYLELEKENLIEEVNIIPGEPGLEDMVFCANQSFPWRIKDGKKQVILSNMKHPSRQKEVQFFKDLYIKKGYEIIELDKQINFEGMGDAIPHPEKNLIFGGYGFRSKNDAYTHISETLKVPIILLELVNENYYHLDTCFLPIDSTTALIASEAFSEESIAILKKAFKDLIEIPPKEALNFALNAHCITNTATNKRAAIIQKGNVTTTAILKKAGFKVYELDTGEFMKSGGSVFCMKMMYY